MHQTFHGVGQLHINAVGCHAGHHAREHLAQLAAHELGLVAILSAALHVQGFHLAGAGLGAGLGRKGLIAAGQQLRLFPGHQVAENAVNGQVGVAADGAGEVGVVAQRQAKMALGVRLILGLAHAAQNAGVHTALQRGAAGLIQQLGQLLLGGGLARKVGVQVAGGENVLQAVQLFGFGGLMRAVDEGHPAGAALVGGALVGQQHTLLNDGLGQAALMGPHVHADAVLIQHQLAFAALDLHAAPGTAGGGAQFVQLLQQGQLAQNAGLLVLLAHLGGLGAVVNAVQLAVHALHPAADDGFHKAVILHIALGVQLHQAAEGQAHHLGVQAADAVGQLPRQHGNDLIGVIHRRTALEGFLVQLAVRGDVVAHVRNVNAQLVAVAHLGQAHRVVNVLGGGRVDGKDGQGAQVQATLHVLFPHLGALQLDGFRLHGIGEMLGQAMGIQNGLGAALGLVGTAEAHGHAHAVLLVAAAAAQDLHRSLLARLYAAVGALLDEQLHGRAGIRLQIQAVAALFLAHGAHKGVFLFGDVGDLALIAALHTGVVKLVHQHLVAGHGALQAAAGDEDIAGQVLPHGKAEGAAQLHNGAGDAVLRLRGGHRRVAGQVVGAHFLHQLALAHQVVQLPHHLALHAHTLLNIPQAAGALLHFSQNLASDGHNLLVLLFRFPAASFLFGCSHHRRAPRQTFPIPANAGLPRRPHRRPLFHLFLGPPAGQPI